MFDTQPYKIKPGYANWEIANPPLKLVVFENADAESGSLNHLGVEVPDTPAVNDATKALVDAGLTTFEEQGVECCYAKQDKVFVTDPDGAEWEWYTVLEDSPTLTKAQCC